MKFELKTRTGLFVNGKLNSVVERTVSEHIEGNGCLLIDSWKWCL